MFEEIICNKHSFDKLKAFLRTINNNIDWDTTCREISDYPVEKIIKKISNYGWSDKDVTMTRANKENDLIYMYTEIINKNKHAGKIGIMCPSSVVVDYTTRHEIDHRLELVTKILSIYGLEHCVSNDIGVLNDCNEILPTASLTYSNDDLRKIDTSKILFPTDDYYSIVRDQNDKQLNDFVHGVINYMDTGELHEYEYNYLIASNFST